MKKATFLISLVFLAGVPFAQAFSSSESTLNHLVDPVIDKDVEISINVFGLFLGSYTLRAEFAVAGDGLLSLGARGTLVKQSFFGVDTFGFQGLGELRLYPARYMRGFYVLLEGGYNYSSVEDDFDSTSIASIPYMAGLGWKKVINEFSFDTGFAYGRRYYLDSPESSDVLDINEFPWNLAFDVYLLVGYRF